MSIDRCEIGKALLICRVFIVLFAVMVVAGWSAIVLNVGSPERILSLSVGSVISMLVLACLSHAHGVLTAPGSGETEDSDEIMDLDMEPEESNAGEIDMSVLDNENDSSTKPIGKDYALLSAKIERDLAKLGADPRLCESGNLYLQYAFQTGLLGYYLRHVDLENAMLAYERSVQLFLFAQTKHPLIAQMEIHETRYYATLMRYVRLRKALSAPDSEIFNLVSEDTTTLEFESRTNEVELLMAKIRMRKVRAQQEITIPNAGVSGLMNNVTDFKS